MSMASPCTSRIFAAGTSRALVTVHRQLPPRNGTLAGALYHRQPATLIIKMSTSLAFFMGGKVGISDILQLSSPRENNQAIHRDVVFELPIIPMRRVYVGSALIRLISFS